jgi:alpha-glucosidase
MKKSLIFFLITLVSTVAFSQKPYLLESPDGHLRVTIEWRDQLSFVILRDQDTLISRSPISMTLGSGEHLGLKPVLKNAKTISINQTISAPFYKRSVIQDHFKEATLTFKGDFSVVFRAYNEGVAYRFVLTKPKEIQITSEEATFRFAGDYKTVVPYVNKPSGENFEQQFFNSFENTYTRTNLSGLDPKRLMFLPLVVEAGKNKVCITEADLEDYPGMYFANTDGKKSLTGVWARHPGKVEQGGYNKIQEIVLARELFIAKTKGTRSFPWRVMAVAAHDKQLLDNDLVYKLASPSRVTDISWIKPGKVSWDWWSDWNLYGVGFPTGVNTTTYKHYIDFASEHKIEYIILDEGWSVKMKADLTQIVPEINMKELVDYGKEKNVGVVLWAGYYAFNKDMENVCRYFSGLGVKGFKVDFMDRDDQAMVNFYYHAAETAARHHLILDFHGAYKPTGLQRTYPNVLNVEGVHGLEQLKWSASADQVTYDVTIPFIRMLAGPMDYTPGAMRNATKENFRPINSEPMSQGTRCRQLAEYVVFEAPFEMLSDNPSNYQAEPECTQFISRVPTTWENTMALDGEIGSFVAVARQKDESWYVGAMTNWDARSLELDLSFLPEGHYKMEVFEDGVNAAKTARDFNHHSAPLPDSKKISVSMAPGGGFVARIYKE